MTTSQSPDLSVIVVSYQTREMTRRCLETLKEQSCGLRLETIVVDNGSTDGSLEMLNAFPGIRVIALERNIGFGPANNRALAEAAGRYFVLLNSDAFLQPQALRRAFDHMEKTPDAGAGGGRLSGPDGTPQPSAWRFPLPWRDFLVYSGIAARMPHSPAARAASVDWVPGAFLILRPEALRKAGLFDERFFLYYEEVDLCRRLKAAGYSVWFWPDVEVVHVGGESAKKITAALSESARRAALWRFRSECLYYRKHHPALTWLSWLLECGWLAVRWLRNAMSADRARQSKAKETASLLRLANQAWADTAGGRRPPAEW